MHSCDLPNNFVLDNPGLVRYTVARQYVLGVEPPGRVVKGTRIPITSPHIRPLFSHVTVEEASFSISGPKDASGTVLSPVNGLCLGIYQKESERWFAVAIQRMLPTPPPQPK